MLWQCCSTSLGSIVETTFRQHCKNVVAVSLPTVGVQWLRQCSGNVVYQCYYPMLYKYWAPNVAAQRCTWSCPVQNDSYIKILNLDGFPTSTSICTLDHSHLQTCWSKLRPTIAAELMGRWWIFQECSLV